MVRRSKPGFSGSMRARYIYAVHSGQSGRAIIGEFSSVYSESVMCESPLFAIGLPRYDCSRAAGERNSSLWEFSTLIKDPPVAALAASAALFLLQLLCCCRAPARLGLIIHVGDRKALVIADNEARTAAVLDRPGRREALGCHVGLPKKWSRSICFIV